MRRVSVSDYANNVGIRILLYDVEERIRIPVGCDVHTVRAAKGTLFFVDN